MDRCWYDNAVECEEPEPLFPLAIRYAHGSGIVKCKLSSFKYLGYALIHTLDM